MYTNTSLYLYVCVYYIYIYIYIYMYMSNTTCLTHASSKVAKHAANSISHIRQVTPQETNEAVFDKQR